MTELFYTILNMSISASILILVVLLLRLLFRKAPKWVTVLLWGLVAVRLICPFAVESPFSLMPKTEWITEEPAYNEENQYFDSVPPDRITVDSEIGNDINVHYYTIPVEPHIEVHRGVNPVFVLNGIWIAGVAAMLVYMLVSYICVYRRIRGAEQFKDNIYTSEAVSSPFVFGLIRPRIYLPENMDAISMSYVIAHEEAHLRRLDHLWKPIGFLLLAVHWFNPLIWIGYILLCRDIEMACDERVVRTMNDEERFDYSEALLACSVSRKMITACPLAFGEVGAKERIMSVLNYKKPAFWIVVMALIACVVAAVCFLTNPITIRNPWVQEYIVGAEGILGQVDKEKYESVHEDFAIGADKYGRVVFKNPLKAFDTMKELYTDGLTLIAEEQELAPISQSNYNLYKKFGWQVTSGSEEAQKQARFVTNFLDIYENSFDKEKPNTDLPAPTVEGETGIETIIASNIFEETLTYWVLKGHQEEIWAYRNTAINDTVDETFRKWGERIAAVGVNDERNCVDVYVYDFDEGDIGRFKKALGHLSYVLIQKDDVIEMIPVDKKQLTLEDVIELSAKGYDLTWEDFYEFKSIETGSGLYIRVYEIDETFSVWIGGGAPVTTPMYIYLSANGLDNHIDIRDGGVEEFIGQYRSSTLSDTAMLYERPISYYVDLAFGVAQSLADSDGITISKDKYNLRHDYNGSNIWIQFYGLTEEGWDDKFVDVALVQKEENGVYHVYEVDTGIIKSNSEQIKATSMVVIGNRFESIVENMQANPSLANKESLSVISAYDQIFVYGEELVLEYIFSEFLTGKHDDLHGDVMMWVMLNLLNENEIIKYDPTNGQDYFDHWLKSARSVGQQHDSAWLEDNVPAIALVLSMLEE